MTATTISPRLVTALDAAWSRIRELHPDVPEVVITMASGSAMTRRSAGRLLGHFAAARWQRGDDQLPELFVSGEGLDRGAQGVLGVLLHEAAHGLAHARGIKDTSRQGRYHTARFRDLAAELGLAVAYDKRVGWSDDSVTDVAAAAYRGVLRRLDAAIVAYRHAEPRGGRAGRASNNNYVPAECACPRKIRVAETVLALGPITCGVCGTDFEAADPGI
jgi:hypothetical protein